MNTNTATDLRKRTVRSPITRRQRVDRVGGFPTLALVHDLRNPVAAVYASAQMLIEGDLSPDQSRRIASSVYRASGHLDRLLKNLLQTWRGEGEVQRLWNLADVVTDVCRAIQAAAQSQMVRLEIDVPDHIEVNIQRTRIESVFLNLLTNALEAMPAGGNLSVGAVVVGEGVLIDIEDSGPGVPDRLRKMLFQPFATGKPGGLGIGLALSRQSAREQQGDLWLGDKVGRGARFCLRLRTK